MLLDEAILARHSTRLYLPRPVPRAALERALELATHAPSHTNTQAWRPFIVTGDALARLKAALGRQVYGEGWGLAHDDAAVLRNFEFFGAPVAVLVCMSAALAGQAALSVGMYAQTLLLALTETGLGSCVEISVAGYPGVVAREVGIPGDLRVLCGVAVGFEDLGARVNRIRVVRDLVERHTAWVQ
ncbi:oxidoreductase [Xylaria grammica]|nr:oxidoreductase [Xylaria grammica]